VTSSVWVNESASRSGGPINGSESLTTAEDTRSINGSGSYVELLNEQGLRPLERTERNEQGL
jgi:hypothetical protein